MPERIESVHPGGAFNQWNFTEHQRSGSDTEGFYEIGVSLPTGRHEYKFVLNDRHWKPDAGTRETTREHGNSVLSIP